MRKKSPAIFERDVSALDNFSSSVVICFSFERFDYV